VNLASIAAAQVDVEDLIGTELVADIDHLSRFGDAVRERFTVQLADVDGNAGVVPASDRVRSPSDLVDYHLADLGNFE